ncbi:uncharacterized protein LOC120005988 [Tripterygium wilfordii]|uniref:uncharacterized protein LOC120005988 n=1 Tax=Tripterygium wilfordii TaxID=458696 RepID=UPI0018F7FE36|nr:uncharacterized protein LOC120005988 [Tripterygium wilfordii]
MKPNSGEEASDYLSRYLEVCAEVEGCDETTTVTSFKIGLPDGCKLKESLVLYEPNTIATWQDRVWRYAKVEVTKGERMTSLRKEERESQNERSGQYGRRVSGRAKHNRSKRSSTNSVEFNMPIHKIFYEVRDQRFLVRSPKMLGDPNRRDKKRYYAFHRDVGHMTEECNNLREHLEELSRQGMLAKYLKNNGTENNKTRDNDMIAIVAGGRTMKITVEGHEAKKMRRTGVDITFLDKDLAGVDPAHNYALKTTMIAIYARLQKSLVGR